MSPFIAPLAFALTALIPVIVALYFLKLRRQEQLISSVYLWQEMVRDVAANAPWQRLRPNWLLLLQILFLVALILALARPFSWTLATTGDHLILIVDTSASMAAHDVEPNRLGQAIEQARRLIASLPAEVPVTLIAAGDQVEVPLSASNDRSRLGQVFDSLRPGSGSADLATALELASAVAAGEADAQIVLLSDGGGQLPARLSSAAALRYIPIGVSGENQAISAISLDPGPGGHGLSAFVRLTNYGKQQVERRLVLTAYPTHPARSGGQIVTVRDLALPADEAVALTVPDLPTETVAIEARLEGTDILPPDDRAWAVAPLIAGAQIQIVGPGNRFLEMALSLLPGVEVTTISPADYEAAWSSAAPQTTDTNWLTIFDTVLPEEGHYPPGALFFLGPLRSGEFFSVTGELTLPTPLPASANDPLLRYVDLREVVVQRAARIPLPAWGRPVIVADDSDGAAPLLVVGERGGRRIAVLAFDLRQSDLPLRVAFPILLANLVDLLAPGAGGALPATVAPAQPLAIPLPPQATAALVTLPDGSTRRLPAQHGSALLDETASPGVYEVAWEAEGERWPLGRFAVNASSPAESDAAPRQELEIAGMENRTIAAEQPVRQEWWRPLVWVALALLLAEWLLQHRGEVVWLWGQAARRRRAEG